MKNYLIESMASYMDKMEKPMPQRKRLNESKKVLSMSKNQFNSLQPYAKEKEVLRKTSPAVKQRQQAMKSVQDKKASRKNESLTEDMDTTIVTNIVDWLADHETAWEDCCNYFGGP